MGFFKKTHFFASSFCSWTHFVYFLLFTDFTVISWRMLCSRCDPAPAWTIMFQTRQPFNVEAAMFKCDKETSSSAVQRRAPDTGAIISIPRNIPICKTLAQHPFISVQFVYILAPFPLCCLVCLPLECWQTVDAPCCGDAESVGVDGQDYATQRSTFLLPHIQPLSRMHLNESVWSYMCFFLCTAGHYFKYGVVCVILSAFPRMVSFPLILNNVELLI